LQLKYFTASAGKPGKVLLGRIAAMARCRLLLQTDSAVCALVVFMFMSPAKNGQTDRDAD